MKKTLLLCSALLGSIVSHAQTINTTFYDPDQIPEYGHNVAILDDGNEIIFSSVGTAGSGKEVLLTLTDPNGNHIRTIFNGDDIVPMHDIVRSEDGGVLLVYKRVNKPDLLFIARFDAGLNPVWMQEMQLNWRSSHIDLENVDVVRKDDRYYITYSEGSPVPGLDFETTFSILCIDDGGGFNWYYNYADASRVPGNPQLDNAVSSITYCEYQGSPAFTVAGTAIENGQLDLFFLTVDDQGNILNDYTRVPHSGNDSDPDVTWDMHTDRIVCTYRSAGPSSNPNVNTSVGLMALRTPGLVWSAGAFYDIALGYNDAGEGVTVDQNGNYLVSAYIDRNAIDGTYGPYLIPINSSTLFWAGAAATYNVFTPKSYYHQQHATDNNDNHYFLTTVYHPNDPTPRPRLIKVDANLDVCGEYNTGFEPTLFNTNEYVINYSQWNPYQPYDSYYDFPEMHYDQDFCDDYGDPDNYRKTQPVTAATDLSATIAPTLLTGRTDAVTCTIVSPKDASVTITVTNLLGQRLYTGTHTATAGTSRFNIPATFASGINMVQIAIDGKVIKTEKLNVLN